MAQTNLSGPLVIESGLEAGTVQWATSGATGGTASASAVTIGAPTDINAALTATSVVSDTYVTSMTGSVFWATRLMKFVAASADWATDARVYVKGDIIWNAAPASGSAVGWICTTAGGPGTAVFTAFGSIW